MSERHAAALWAACWFGLWGVIGHFDSSVSVLESVGIGAALLLGGALFAFAFEKALFY